MYVEDTGKSIIFKFRTELEDRITVVQTFIDT